ncbi:hypothetical protein V8G54_001812 [Vigna mungo]|uniref:Uncharacterized protein n=1 Tax=Vigna mungo TaxID=3915 RepID=A0AAQ3SBA1_VIGMU
MCSENGDFSVSVTNEEVVAAVLPMQEYWLPLSNLDLLLPPLDVGVFFCYKNPNIITSTTNEMTFGTMVGSLKKALAQTLISYYVFAGEVVLNSMGEPEVLCNNRGVHFLEAEADVQLKNLNFYNPDQSIEGKFVPKKKNGGIIAIQATALQCGGIIVACTFDHMYTSISDLPPPTTTYANALLSRIYYITAEQLCHMQSLAVTRTKLECFSAFLWKMVACVASRNINSKKITVKMGIVVDGRKRLDNGNKESKVMIECYFGNVLSIPFGEKLVEELVKESLGYVMEFVHEFLSVATKEHFLGLVIG